LSRANTNSDAVATSHPSAIDLRNVTYRIGTKRILNDISWRINRGEHWAVLGPNGSGKTTLLRMVCGYLWPNDGGRILRNGQALLDLRELRRGIGWVSCSLCTQIPPSELVLHTVISGKFAQIGLWPEWLAGLEGQVLEQARLHLGELDCAGLADRRFETLSQGEQQKLLIARARMARPFMIILDEPCAGRGRSIRMQRRIS